MVLQWNNIMVSACAAFQCTKFQGNWTMHLCFITTFTPWKNPKKLSQFKKPKKLSQFLKVHISEMLGAI